MNDLLQSLFTWFLTYKVNIILSVIILAGYILFHRKIRPKIEQYIEKGDIKSNTIKSAILSLDLFSGIIVFVLILIIWGFNFRGLLAFSTGLIAITGVALFASWSILSNITAFFILLAQSSYKRGNFVRILEMDNYIEGYISEINLFNTKLISEAKEIVIYPNNLLIARPAIINPENRFSGFGKTQEFSKTSIDEEKRG